MDIHIASWVLTKCLSLTYFIAFLSLTPQVLGLFGRQGILSIDHLLNLLDRDMKAERFYHLPSVFWLSSSDRTLKFVCLAGMTAASLAFLGFSQSIMFAVCFLCYLSFVSCGQIFLTYQWDALLLELGFLGLFFAPWRWEWLPLSAYELHPAIYLLALLLLFKLMFLSGVIKLTHKDLSWKNFSAMSFHYWTQPLPTPLAFFFHKLPFAAQRFSTAVMFFIELVVPFFIFIPGPVRIIAVSLIVFLQVMILLTGNYGFFNLITLGLSLAVLPDSSWGFVINWVQPHHIPNAVAFAVCLILIPGHIFWIYKTLFEKSTKLNFMLPFMRFIYPFRLNNPYGLFAVMTKSRPEIIMQGSMDGNEWTDYELNYKPGNPRRAPPVVAPHQPRLDWQMWFAALEDFNENLWLQNLATRVFENSSDVISLFQKNPFPKEPPQFLRFVRYEYGFSSFQELLQHKRWWNRQFIGTFGPTFTRDLNEDED